MRTPLLSVSRTLPILLVLAACGGEPQGGAVDEPANLLTLTVTGSETSPDGQSCAFSIAAANTTGSDIVNVQVAYMAETDGPSLSEYVVLGDFASGEQKDGRIFVTGAACDAVRSLKLTRAVCTVSPVADPAESCADAVALQGGGVVEVLSGE